MVFAAAGIATPKPLAWVERRAVGPQCESVLVTDNIPNSQTLRELLDTPELPLHALRRLIEHAARFVADVHLAGYCHGNQSDLRPLPP